MKPLRVHAVVSAHVTLVVFGATIREHHPLELCVRDVGSVAHESAANLLRLRAHRRLCEHQHLQQLAAVDPEQKSMLEGQIAHILICFAPKVGTHSVLGDRLLKQHQ